MKTRYLLVMALGAALLTLSACGEKPQAMGGNRHAVAPFEGAGDSPFVQSGWKAGDRNSWEQQLKARAQYGQNDYTRMGQ
ncbi:hypothetical protein [Hydrogenophaga sp.]|uniref:hypothetical protein n=1 Tax=Hydrogenophaga sp. TaxID=1904254 RepID=UPI0035615060